MPKTGRPPLGELSRTRGYRLRMSNDELERLDYCCRVLGFPKAEVLRQGLDFMYEKALEMEGKTPESIRGEGDKLEEIIERLERIEKRIEK